MNPGDPDDHGRYAQLTFSDDGTLVLCHECGAWKKAIGTHAWYAHGITARISSGNRDDSAESDDWGRGLSVGRPLGAGGTGTERLESMAPLGS